MANASSAGGGAGGAIWIDATGGTFTGAGTLSANGGAQTSTNGAGAGGRVAIYYTTDTSSGARQAFGGSSNSGTGPLDRYGGAGTVYAKSAAQANGSLTVDNNNQVSTTLTTQLTSPQTYDAIASRGGANYSIPAGMSLTSATTTGTISGGGTQYGNIYVDGELVVPTASFTFSGVNIYHNASVKTLTNPTVLNGTYNVQTDTALFTSGTANRVNDVKIGRASCRERV